MQNFQTFNHGHDKQNFLSNAESVVKTLNWKIANKDETSLHCKVGMSFDSFGEKIEISSVQDKTANITVSTVNPIQIADNERGQKLIKKFIEGYQSQFLS